MPTERPHLMERYKEIELAHYERKAQRARTDDLGASGAASVDAALRAPYFAFEAAIRWRAESADVVVDLGAGTGVHSLIAAGAGLRVPVDISLSALSLAAMRGTRAGIPLAPLVADAERLPLKAGSVDVVTSAGALYCFDFDGVSDEICRILKPDGVWVIVDSFDHNPVYRLNRRLGRLRGRRTRLAVENIPDLGTLHVLGGKFRSVSVEFFGVFAFLAPVLRLLAGDERAAAIVDRLDRLAPALRRYAFKIVVIADTPVHAPHSEMMHRR